MIFNPEITREAICGLEISPEHLAEIDKEMEEVRLTNLGHHQPEDSIKEKEKQIRY